MVGLDGRGLKVLVIEDSTHFRLLIHTVLQTLGAGTIREAADGAAGLDMLRDFPADLVIADWKMEPMDGIRFTRKVRLGPDSSNPRLPVIMVTGYFESRLAAEARDAGVNEFLAKPVSAKMLLAHILSVLERPRPFIRTPTFFGPDRRRRQLPFHGPDRRHAGAGAVAAGE